nr:hypothetical protein [Tanacetum cinerariifolium]
VVIDRLVSRAKVIENQVMAISVISVSSDSSEDSMGTPTGRVILFAPTIPSSPDYTPASPDYSPASETESYPSEDPSSGHIPPLPAVSLFLSSDDDTTYSDTPDTPPSPTHDTPFTEITASTQRSPVIPRRRVMILEPEQPILRGRPYRYHPNGPVHMMTARKRVRPLPVQQLSVRHSIDRSSSDSSSRHALSDHSSPDLPSTSAGLSRKRRRSPMTSVPALQLVSRALYPIRAHSSPDLPSTSAGPSRKRRRSPMTSMKRLVQERLKFRGLRILRCQRIFSSLLRREQQRKMPNKRFGTSMTHEEVEELVARRVTEEMEAREAARNLETLNENEEEQEGENGETEEMEMRIMEEIRIEETEEIEMEGMEEMGIVA